jgi:hypothetical protein
MALGFTQPLKEMGTSKSFWGKARPARKSANLTAICEPTVYTIWDPRHLTTLQDSTAWYKNSFTVLLLT